MATTCLNEDEDEYVDDDDVEYTNKDVRVRGSGQR